MAVFSHCAAARVADSRRNRSERKSSPPSNGLLPTPTISSIMVRSSSAANLSSGCYYYYRDMSAPVSHAKHCEALRHSSKPAPPSSSPPPPAFSCGRSHSLALRKRSEGKRLGEERKKSGGGVGEVEAEPFLNSPHPSSLPVPKFCTRKPIDPVSATHNLRRMLNLAPSCKQLPLRG